MDYKTPGVYIEEIPLFPPSIAAVSTAIPAFIGHTAKTVDPDGVTLINRPIRITSFLDFTTIYGVGYDPDSYTVQIDPGADFIILATFPANQRIYYLFDAVRQYFDNGGGPCYIATVGNYAQPVVYGTDITGLRGGLRAIEKVDEPTILVAPETVALVTVGGDPDFTASGNLHKDMTTQCANLQDRFALLDIVLGHQSPAAQIGEFRNETGTENLKYAASYYPWLCSTYRRVIHFSQLSFVDNQAPPVPVLDATIDNMSGSPILDALVISLRGEIAVEDRVFGKITAIALNRNNYNPLSAQLVALRSTLMAATTAVESRPAFSALILFVRELALAFRDLENDAGNPGDLTLQLTNLGSDISLQSAISSLIAFEKNINVMSSIALARVVGDVENDYASLDNEDWVGGVALNTIAAEGTDFTDGGGNSISETAQSAANSTILQTAFDIIADAFAAIISDSIFRTNQAEKNLIAQHPFFKAVYERVNKDMSLIPPSGAVAGVYAATDRSRGVWKAPANISLRSVIAPSYKLTDQGQSTLNVHESGKSINAIRAFTGKGTLVWGARTLAGNDNEWRFVNVRRFFNFAEESIKKATEPFVFEGNDANTWVRVRAMIENFLTIQWRQGALTGSTTREAFFVKVGIGETMTTLDILEGRMIVEIGMAAVRPAEFIILRFSHKMQES